MSLGASGISESVTRIVSIVCVDSFSTDFDTLSAVVFFAGSSICIFSEITVVARILGVVILTIRSFSGTESLIDFASVIGTGILIAGSNDDS